MNEHLLTKTKNKLHIEKRCSVNLDIREYQKVLLKLRIQMKQLELIQLWRPQK